MKLKIMNKIHTGIFIQVLLHFYVKILSADEINECGEIFEIIF